MPICNISTKKFKEFELKKAADIGAPDLYPSTPSNNYHHNSQDVEQNQVYLVGYQYNSDQNCPEIKIKLNDLCECNCQLYLYVDGNNLYYSLDGPITEDNFQEYEHVQLPVNSGSSDVEEITGVVINYTDDPQQSTVTGGTLNLNIYSPLRIRYNETSNVIEYAYTATVDENTQWQPLVAIPQGGGSTGGDPIVGIVDITSEHESDTHQTAVTVTYTSGNPDTFYIPDGQDGAVPEFRMTNDGMIQYRFNNGDEWVDLGQAQQGGEVNNNTFAFNIQENKNDCVAVGDAYIELDRTSQYYGHLRVWTGANFRNCGRIVGSDGTSVKTLEYIPSNNLINTVDGYDSSITATRNQSMAGGVINCYQLLDGDNNPLSYIYIANGADGTNGTSVHHVDCTTPNGGVSESDVPSDFDPTSGAINEFTLYADSAGQVSLGNFYVKNGVDGNNTSGSGQSYTGGSVTIGQNSTGVVDITGNVISVVLPNNLQTPPVLNNVSVSTPSIGSANGSFSPVTGTPGAYDLSLTIPVTNGHTPTIEIDDTTPGVHQINIDNTPAASIKDGTTMELYRLVASNFTAVAASNGNYYQLDNYSPSWLKYNPTNGNFEAVARPKVSTANFVEVCPADTNISDVIDNLTYGTCGMYDGVNDVFNLYAVKNPATRTLCFTIKAYYNIQS